MGGPGHRPQLAWAGSEGGPLSPGGRGRAPWPRPMNRVLPPGGRALPKRAVACGFEGYVGVTEGRPGRQGSTRGWGHRVQEIRGGDPERREWEAGAEEARVSQEIGAPAGRGELRKGTPR